MILVTGGAGYIGVVLVEELLKRGEKVRVFDKLYFKEKPLEKFKDKVELIQGDICQFDLSVLDGVKSVIHLGGLSNDPMAEFNPQATLKINAQGTKELAQACKRKGIHRFVYASSASIYDKGLSSGDILQDERSKVAPSTAYSYSKFKGEESLLELADKDFCPVILRQGTAYGFSPRMRYDLVVNTFVKDAFKEGRLTLFAEGKMWRPLIDITDVVEAYILCLKAEEEKVRGEVFNLLFKNFQVLELAHCVKEALKDILPVEIVVEQSPKIVRSYRISAQKIEDVLGFKPCVSIASSVLNMVKKIREYNYTDFSNPWYYNIDWMRKVFGDKW